MSAASSHLLAGDVGGTKALIGLFDATRRADQRDAPALVVERTYPTADFGDLSSLLRRFLADVAEADPRVVAACFGVAGPVKANRLETGPWVPWIVDGAEIAGKLDVDSVRIVNDLVASAHGVAALRTSEVITLNKGSADACGPRALLAAGTGLGAAQLVDAPHGLMVLPSEGGHVDLAPQTPEQIALLEHLSARFPSHVSLERAASGTGITDLYRFARARLGPDAPEADDVRRAMTRDPGRAAPRISAHALAGDDPCSTLAMQLFVDLLGAAAGNFALTCLSTGGVYLGGGIVPRILPLLTDGRFTRAFVSKGRFEKLMRDIPVHAVLNPRMALLGAARLAAESA